MDVAEIRARARLVRNRFSAKLSRIDVPEIRVQALLVALPLWFLAAGFYGLRTPEGEWSNPYYYLSAIALLCWPLASHAIRFKFRNWGANRSLLLKLFLSIIEIAVTNILAVGSLYLGGDDLKKPVEVLAIVLTMLFLFFAGIFLVDEQDMGLSEMFHGYIVAIFRKQVSENLWLVSLVSLACYARKPFILVLEHIEGKQNVTRLPSGALQHAEEAIDMLPEVPVPAPHAEDIPHVPPHAEEPIDIPIEAVAPAPAPHLKVGLQSLAAICEGAEQLMSEKVPGSIVQDFGKYQEMLEIINNLLADL